MYRNRHVFNLIRNTRRTLLKSSPKFYATNNADNALETQQFEVEQEDKSSSSTTTTTTTSSSSTNSSASATGRGGRTGGSIFRQKREGFVASNEATRGRFSQRGSTARGARGGRGNLAAKSRFFPATASQPGAPEVMNVAQLEEEFKLAVAETDMLFDELPDESRPPGMSAKIEKKQEVQRAGAAVRTGGTARGSGFAAVRGSGVATSRGSGVAASRGGGVATGRGGRGGGASRGGRGGRGGLILGGKKETKDEDIVSEADTEDKVHKIGDRIIYNEKLFLRKHIKILKDHLKPAVLSLKDLKQLNTDLENTQNDEYVRKMSNAIMNHIVKHNIIHHNDLHAILFSNSTNKFVDSIKDFHMTLKDAFIDDKKNGSLTPEEDAIAKFAPNLLKASTGIERILIEAKKAAPEEKERETEIDTDENKMEGEEEFNPDGVSVKKVAAEEVQPKPFREKATDTKVNLEVETYAEQMEMLASLYDNSTVHPLFVEKMMELRLMQLKKEGKLTTDILDAYSQRIPLEILIKRMRRDLIHRLSVEGAANEVDLITQDVINNNLKGGLAAKNIRALLEYEQQHESQETKDQEADQKSQESFFISPSQQIAPNPEQLDAIIPELQPLLSDQLVTESYLVQLNHLQHMKNVKTAKIREIYEAIREKIESKKNTAGAADIKDDSIHVYDIPVKIRELIDMERAEKNRKSWMNHFTDEEDQDQYFLKYDSFSSYKRFERNFSLLRNDYAQKHSNYLESKYNDFTDETNPMKDLVRGEGYLRFKRTILDSHIAVRKARFERRIDEYEYYVEGKTLQMPHIKDVEAVETAGKKGRRRIIAPMERYMDEYIDQVPPSLARERLINNIRAISNNPTLSIKEKQAVIRGLRDAYIANGLHQVQLTEENMPIKIYPGKRTHMHPNRVNPRDAAAADLLMHRSKLYTESLPQRTAEE